MFRARLAMFLGLALCLAPGMAGAKTGHGGGGHGGSGGKGGHSGGNAHAAAPVPAGGRSHYGGYRGARGYAYGYGGRFGGGYGYGRGIYGNPGYYGGYYGGYYRGWGLYPWGYYGYGYYPLWGGPVIAEQVPVRPPPITSSLFVGGMLSGLGGGLDFRFATDGDRWGVNFNLLTMPWFNPTDGTDVHTMPLMNAHLTFAVISNLHLRVRVEAGGSAAFIPGMYYVGPDVGTSATLAIVGPLAVDASVRWTPIPADILDADAGLGLHFGNLALRAGWRVIRFDDRNPNPDTGQLTIYNGPTASIGLLF